MGRNPELQRSAPNQVVQYLYYKLRYTNHPANTPLPAFKIEPEIALELLMERAARHPDPLHPLFTLLAHALTPHTDNDHPRPHTRTP